MKIQPVRGTNDYLPYEVRIRDYIQDKILETYQNHGFERISTPIMESIDNLDKSEGGDNLNLIFKIMKRGDKLKSALDEGRYGELADMGLRYDLTLPLARYFANNKDKLMIPFKSIQIDRAFRAERPQKGRLREFVQCDIDIIGSGSINCEIELIDTTAKALLNIGMKGFTVRVSDRRILRNILLNVGFMQDELDGACIVFDKMDKIGLDGVACELRDKGYDTEVIKRFLAVINKTSSDNEVLNIIKECCDDEAAVEGIALLLDAVRQLSGGAYDIKFDISLVRGQGYYTGMVFEIHSNIYKGSIAGGGRYDGLVGKFTNESMPAVGFSIGFERISDILIENGYKVPDARPKVALIHNENETIKAITLANEMRDEYDVRLFVAPKKLGKLLDKIQEQGYYGYYVTWQGELKKISF